VTGRQRLAVAALVLGGVLAAMLVVVIAGRACPTERPGQPCPDAVRNVIVVVALAAATVALLVTPFAFLGEFVVRRRIIYRGAWWRAARRGLLSALLLAALAGLRLGGALTVPAAIFVAILAVLVERFLATRDR